jgi:hypothetical protein
MTSITKTDIAAIRSADTLCVHLNKTNSTGLIRLIKGRDRAKPFSEDQEYVLPCSVELHGYNHRTAIENGAQCFAHVYLFHSQHTPVSCIMNTLRAGDEVTFVFYPDAHSNGYLAKAGLHGDALYMHVRRGDKRYEWNLQTSTCPENSARMCRGVPPSQSYLDGAAA